MDRLPVSVALIEMGKRPFSEDVAPPGRRARNITLTLISCELMMLSSKGFPRLMNNSRVLFTKQFEMLITTSAATVVAFPSGTREVETAAVGI